MKKQSRFETKMTEVEVVDYIAEDGTVFADERSCLQHEEQIQTQAMLQVPHSYIEVNDLLDEGYDDEQYVALYPRNQEEIDTICRCCPEIYPDEFASCKSQMFLFVYGGYSAYASSSDGIREEFNKPAAVYHLGSVDSFFSDMIRRLHRQWDRMLQEVGDGLPNN